MYWIRGCYGKLALATVMMCFILADCAGPATHSNTLPPMSALSLRTGESIAVVGVKLGQLKDVNKGSVRNPRIGFGLNDLLTQSLFDKGKFTLVEAEVRKSKLLKNLVNTYWIERRSHYPEQELPSIAEKLGVELLAYGTVSYKSVEKEVFIGPFSRIEQKLQVAANVCLYKVSTGDLLCRDGRGEAWQKGMAVIYKFSGDHIDFEKSAAGIATKKAVYLAVKRLMESIHFFTVKGTFYQGTGIKNVST
ncbi:MAG: hypothetical protein GY774_39505 [Planctomycetes bacterium]|nr:hypothetical protein [Planctomycetota bacterium]